MMFWFDINSVTVWPVNFKAQVEPQYQHNELLKWQTMLFVCSKLYAVGRIHKVLLKRQIFLFICR
jgi:hypothetical protein